MCNHSVVKLHEATQMFVMVDYRSPGSLANMYLLSICSSYSVSGASATEESPCTIPDSTLSSKLLPRERIRSAARHGWTRTTTSHA